MRGRGGRHDDTQRAGGDRGRADAQDAQWEGAEHDDALRLPAFIQRIGDHAGWARVKAREGSMVEARQRLVQVAA